MDKENYFECCICMEKTDNPDESIHAISELADQYKGQYHLREEWICKECYLDLIHEKQIDKYSEDFG